MIPEFLLFWGVAALSLAGGLGVVFAPRAAHAVMSLLVVMIALAVAFFTLGSPMLAAMQVIVYAGAVIVMFLFVVMLLDLSRELPSLIGRRGALPVFAVTGVALLAAVLLLVLLKGGLPPAAPRYPGGDAKTVGMALFTVRVGLFLLVGILLTAAADGVVGLTRKEDSE